MSAQHGFCLTLLCKGLADVKTDPTRLKKLAEERPTLLSRICYTFTFMFAHTHTHTHTHKAHEC